MLGRRTSAGNGGGSRACAVRAGRGRGWRDAPGRPGTRGSGSPAERLPSCWLTRHRWWYTQPGVTSQQTLAGSVCKRWGRRGAQRDPAVSAARSSASSPAGGARSQGSRTRPGMLSAAPSQPNTSLVLSESTEGPCEAGRVPVTGAGGSPWCRQASRRSCSFPSEPGECLQVSKSTRAALDPELLQGGDPAAWQACYVCICRMNKRINLDNGEDKKCPPAYL